jgi:cytochrome c oxidase subunit 2
MWNFPLFPDQASTLAPKVDMLFGAVLLVTAFFSTLIAFLIIFFSIKYHHTSKADRRGAPNSHILLELAWTLIPLGIVLVIFGFSTYIFYGARNIPANALEFFVVGKQWMWKIQHPEGQREINALHVPIGQPIELTMISEDVIHDFAIPAFRIKEDVLPGRYTHQWFEATKTGRYTLFCDQYCGTLHASMIGTVTVMEPKEYQDWLSGSTGTSGSMSANGAALFTRMACASCHLNNGQGRGPSLSGLYGRSVALADGRTVTADEAYVRESILKPSAKLVRGYSNIMPTFQNQVSEQNILELIEYIKTLQASEKMVKQ